MIGGALEGNGFRDFAYRQLQLPVPQLTEGRYPPRRATIIDRGATDGAPASRGFANLDQMLRIMRKYNVTFEVVTDAQVCGSKYRWFFVRLNTRVHFRPAARRQELLRPGGTVWAVRLAHHGARCCPGQRLCNSSAVRTHLPTSLARLHNETSLLPPSTPRLRSAVIEIYPRGMWCDIYKNMLTVRALWLVFEHLRSTERISTGFFHCNHRLLACMFFRSIRHSSDRK